MSKHFFDYDDGDYVHSISDNMAIDSDGNMMMRRSRSCRSAGWRAGCLPTCSKHSR